MLAADSRRSLLRQVIFKVAQRCNLDCDYCYVYNMGDSSWRERPRFADDATVLRLAECIRAHCDKHHIHRMHLELHGGEPLLFGHGRMRHLLQTMIEVVGRDRITFSLQTNGLLLSEQWVDIFEQYAVHVGVSLDGPPSSKPHRVDKRGIDSTPRLLSILAHLQQARPAFRPGVLAVLNDETDVAVLVDWFPSIGVNSFDLLFPLGNYLTKPIGITDKRRLTDSLIRGFDCWYSKGSSAPQVRLFELLIEGFLGHKIVLDSLGGDLRALCVVESDGSLGMNDVTRFIGGHFSRDEINIHSCSLDRHDEHFQVVAAQQLSEKCKSCEVLNACGGGYLPDRFDGATFQNPSYYCDVLHPLCIHVLRRLEGSIPKHAWTTGTTRC